MRRRTQIVLAITFMVAALVSGASYIYITQILRQGINTTHDTATNVAAQIAYLATNAAPDLSSTRVDTTNPEAVRRGVAYYLGTDRDLNTVLDSVVGSYPTIYDAAVLDSDGKAILDTDPNLIGKKIADRPDFSQLQQAGFRRKLRMVYNPPTIYDVHLPLMLDGQPFGSIHVGVSTVFLATNSRRGCSVSCRFRALRSCVRWSLPPCFPTSLWVPWNISTAVSTEWLRAMERS